MKKFWKENSYDIVKMFIYQMGMTVFGLVVSMAAIKLSISMNLPYGERWILSLGSVFGAGLYVYLLGYMTAEIGSKDGIRIEAGRLEYNRLKGLYMSLMANAINIVLALTAIIGKLCVTNIGFFSDDAAVEAVPAFAGAINTVSELILKLINGMYLGLQVEYFSGNPLFYLLIIAPSLLVCTLAYMRGVNRITKGGSVSEEARKRYEMRKEDNDIHYQQ